ncbi:hypothetical protein GALMADRAFT_256385 [Galerina marginata CBS 339.88]|uniref:Uncharacterized protein n=1 Tax=Galerina marginata (strain CBS 339.88) TaxID=685588 RepID=A0A067SD84_GALM3|nr:hypothetical protein GALMADRAFT_256385 [Galerina marginata CBS 339.88]
MSTHCTTPFVPDDEQNQHQNPDPNPGAPPPLPPADAAIQLTLERELPPRFED